MENGMNLTAAVAEIEETLEEHIARMKKIAEEVKADIKAGRYRHGQIHPHIRDNYAGSPTGRVQEHSDYMKRITRSLFHELHLGDFEEIIRGRSKVDMQMITLDSLFSPSRRPIPMMVMDECHYIKPESFWIRPTKEKDWDQKKFVSGPATTPSEATRLKRREERNRKKKKK